jgi:hypothetical protein
MAGRPRRGLKRVFLRCVLRRVRVVLAAVLDLGGRNGELDAGPVLVVRDERRDGDDPERVDGTVEVEFEPLVGRFGTLGRGTDRSSPATNTATGG